MLDCNDSGWDGTGDTSVLEHDYNSELYNGFKSPEDSLYRNFIMKSAFP